MARPRNFRTINAPLNPDSTALVQHSAQAGSDGARYGYAGLAGLGQGIARGAKQGVDNYRAFVDDAKRHALMDQKIGRLNANEDLLRGASMVSPEEHFKTLAGQPGSGVTHLPKSHGDVANYQLEQMLPQKTLDAMSPAMRQRASDIAKTILQTPTAVSKYGKTDRDAMVAKADPGMGRDLDAIGRTTPELLDHMGRSLEDAFRGDPILGKWMGAQMLRDHAQHEAASRGSGPEAAVLEKNRTNPASQQIASAVAPFFDGVLKSFGDRLETLTERVTRGPITPGEVRHFMGRAPTRAYAQTLDNKGRYDPSLGAVNFQRWVNSLPEATKGVARQLMVDGTTSQGVARNIKTYQAAGQIVEGLQGRGQMGVVASDAHRGRIVRDVNAALKAHGEDAVQAHFATFLGLDVDPGNSIMGGNKQALAADLGVVNELLSSGKATLSGVNLTDSKSVNKWLDPQLAQGQVDADAWTHGPLSGLAGLKASPEHVSKILNDYGEQFRDSPSYDEIAKAIRGRGIGPEDASRLLPRAFGTFQAQHLQLQNNWRLHDDKGRSWDELSHGERRDALVRMGNAVVDRLASEVVPPQTKPGREAVTPAPGPQSQRPVPPQFSRADANKIRDGLAKTGDLEKQGMQEVQVPGHDDVFLVLDGSKGGKPVNSFQTRDDGSRVYSEFREKDELGGMKSGAFKVFQEVFQGTQESASLGDLPNQWAHFMMGGTGHKNVDAVLKSTANGEPLYQIIQRAGHQASGAETQDAYDNVLTGLRNAVARNDQVPSMGHFYSELRQAASASKDPVVLGLVSMFEDSLGMGTSGHADQELLRGGSVPDLSALFADPTQPNGMVGGQQEGGAGAAAIQPDMTQGMGLPPGVEVDPDIVDAVFGRAPEPTVKTLEEKHPGLGDKARAGAKHLGDRFTSPGTLEHLMTYPLGGVTGAIGDVAEGVGGAIKGVGSAIADAVSPISPSALESARHQWMSGQPYLEIDGEMVSPGDPAYGARFHPREERTLQDHRTEMEELGRSVLADEGMSAEERALQHSWHQERTRRRLDDVRRDEMAPGDLGMGSEASSDAMVETEHEIRTRARGGSWHSVALMLRSYKSKVDSDTYNDLIDKIQDLNGFQHVPEDLRRKSRRRAPKDRLDAIERNRDRDRVERLLRLFPRDRPPNPNLMRAAHREWEAKRAYRSGR